MGACLLACGGGTTIRATWPKPDITLPASEESLALEIGPSVENASQVLLVNRKTPPKLAVTDEWRTTLARGFEKGFGKAFKAAPGGRTLRIDEARLHFLQISPRDGQAVIRFRAALLDRSGGQIRSTSGVVTARRTSVFDSAGTLVAWGASSAVEAMYEVIAHDLLGGPPVQAACKPGTGVARFEGQPGTYVPGDPGTPDSWIPGFPGTPPFCSGGFPGMGVDCTAGTPGDPPIFVPGTPPTPGHTIAGVSARPPTKCVPTTEPESFAPSLQSMK